MTVKSRLLSIVFLAALIMLGGLPDQTSIAKPLATYTYDYVSQNPSGQFWMDSTRTFEVRYRNTGTDTWYRNRSYG